VNVKQESLARNKTWMALAVVAFVTATLLMSSFFQTHAQTSIPYVYVFVDPAVEDCSNLVNYTTGELQTGAPTPYDTLAPYEWVEIEKEVTGSDGSNLGVDHTIIVCYSFDPYGTDQTVEDNTFAEGSGGYRVSFDIGGGVYPSYGNLFSINSTQGEGAQCNSGSESSADTYDPTSYFTDGGLDGLKFFNEVYVGEAFCTGTPYGHIIARLRFYGDWPNEPTATPTNTPTNTPTATSTPDATATLASASCGEGQVLIDGMCQWATSPLETPVPPTCPACSDGEHCEWGECVADRWPTPTPGVAIQRMDVEPDLCPGAELLWEEQYLDYEDAYVKVIRPPLPDYAAFNVRYWVYVPLGASYQAYMSINSTQYDISTTLGDGLHEGFYQVVLPNPPLSGSGGADVRIEIANYTPGETMMVASVCLQPLPELEECINLDPYLDSSIIWNTQGDVNFSEYGGAFLNPDDYVYQTYNNLDVGSYELIVEAAAIHPSTVMLVNTSTEQGNEIMTILPGGPPAATTWSWDRYQYYFDATESDYNLSRPIGVGSDSENHDDENPKLIYIHKICLKEVPLTPTPNPTATPDPGSIYPGDEPATCSNTDFGFNAPDAWQLSMAQIDDSVLSLRNYGSYAWITSTHAAGTYNFMINVCSAPYSSDSCTARQLEFSISGTGVQRHAYITLLDDGQCHDYSGSIIAADYSGNPFDVERVQLRAICVDASMQQRAAIPDLNSVYMQVPYVCLYGGVPPDTTPPPTPTSPPGMTPTPTPTGEPSPMGCLNYDSGMNDEGYWALTGGAQFKSSTVVMFAGSKLFAEIDQDSARQYNVEIYGACSHHSGATITWRNTSQTWSCTSPGVDSYPFLFSSASAPGTLAQPLSALLDEQWNPPVLLSPLETPNAVALGAHPFNARLSADMFQIEAFGSNGGQMEIHSICIKDAGWAPTPEPEEEDLEVYHPVCERDYSIQKRYQDSVWGHFYGMLLGPGRKGGMPVHAIAGGDVVNYGLPISYIFGDEQWEYFGCVVINHQPALNVNMQTLYCNLDTFSIPDSGIVERGALLGHTSAERDGVLAFAIQLDGDWVNPKQYFEGYPDCRPYNVYIEPQEPCDADDGSGIIPPRFNPDTPGFWDVDEWVPWLAQRLYDVVGYPILCAIVPIINNVISTLVSFANAVIEVIAPPLIFLYRIGRIFEYMLYVFQRVLNELYLLFDAVGYVTVCIRAIITYFIAAIRAAVDADIAITIPAENTLFGFAFALAMTLISSTVANVILVPLVGLFIAYTAWKLVPWGIRSLGKGVGIVK